MASSSSAIFRGLAFPHCNGRNPGFFLRNHRTPLIVPRVPITRSTLALSRRRNRDSAITSSKMKRLPGSDDAKEEDFDEDAIEALFNQLEEDLKNDLSADDGDDEISEEDLAKLEQELEEAIGSDDELSRMFNSSEDSTESDDDAVEDEDEDEEERTINLKTWQLRRLASALKIGRRKTSIKSLASELCLDRAFVLELLREPPPNLLLMSAALPDKVMPTTLEPEAKPVEPSSMEATVDVVEHVPQVKMPVHVRQSRWSMQKRLKKVQMETLERVYKRTKRPTNAMISSIVHVSNLPRKRVVKWFEDKRAEDGVPQNRLPYQRSTPDTVFTD